MCLKDLQKGTCTVWILEVPFRLSGEPSLSSYILGLETVDNFITC